MAKRKTKIEEPIKEIQEVKQLPTKEYTIKNRVKVGGNWKEKKDKIKLTKEGAEFFRSKNYI